MSERVRLDVWLWRARFFKTRALAADFVGAGGLRLARAGAARRLEKPGEAVGAGDLLTFAPRGDLLTLRIEAVGERRGPAPEARALYALLDGPGADSHVTPAEEDGPA